MACVQLWRTWIEPVVAGAQIASSFYDTGLLMVVKNYYNNSNSSSVESREDALQRAMSNFYIIYNLVTGLCPLGSAYILARLGEKKHVKITMICVPLIGYLISRLFLLFVILLHWPIEVMYGSAALNGLTGGFTTYWAGVMTLGSLGSSDEGRSLRLIIIEMIYGLAGFFGSLSSGHIFVHFDVNYHQGTVLVSCSLAFYLFCVLYSLIVFKVPETGDRNHGNSVPDQADGETGRDKYGPQNTEQSERTKLLDERPGRSSTLIHAQGQTAVTPSKIIIAMLFISAILYNLAVAGAVDVLNLYLIKEPLNWGAVDIGYGNAAGYLIFITSFLGVYAFSKCLRDTTVIVIGMASFSAGIYIMSFVRWTFLYYIARAVMLFSLIPLPTIRSSISKQVQGSSYGKVFVILQLALSISGVVTSTVYNKIYQATLDWFSGFCFLLSCIIGTLSIIPISIVACNQPSRPQSSSNSEE